MSSRGRALARKLLGQRGAAAAQALLRAGSDGAATNDAAERERLAAAADRLESTRLHVGCGPRVLRGWLNVDLAFEPFECYLAYYGDRFYPPESRGDRSDFFAVDVTQGLPFKRDSVDLVFHEDFLEHISQRDALGFLAEVLRVLKPGGVHRVNTPDLIASMREHSEFSRGCAGVYFDEWDRHAHLHAVVAERDRQPGGLFRSDHLSARQLRRGIRPARISSRSG